MWVEKYRPRKVSECVLPDNLKRQFQGYVDRKEVPNLVLTGRAGVGKTTVAKAMLDELGLDSLVIPASTHGNVDTLRTEITQFAATVSFTGGRKHVILDEADGMSQAMQQGLRNVMEAYIGNCGFILTCNYVNKLIEPLRSRNGTIEFKFPAEGEDDRAQLQLQFFQKVKGILTAEGVKYETGPVVEVVKKYFPDFRRTLNELQRYAGSGAIDSGILVNVTEEAIRDVIALVKGKRFKEMRQWVADHGDLDPPDLFTMVYDHAYQFFAEHSVPLVVHTVNEFQKSHAVVANPEINVAAFFTVLMSEAEFK